MYTGNTIGSRITFKEDGTAFFKQYKNSNPTYQGTYSFSNSTLTLKLSWTMESTGVTSSFDEKYSAKISNDKLTLKLISGKWKMSSIDRVNDSSELSCLIAQCWQNTTGEITLDKATENESVDNESYVIIPSDVTEITSEYFEKLCEDSGTRCNFVKKVVIPDGVTSIGEYAFSHCPNLTSIIIPNSVTYIGKQAFNGCTSLTSITIPNSVTSIGEDVFRGCTSLTSITIPNSVASIPQRTFYGCTSLASITIPDSVTNIVSYAFYGCTSLASVFIPDSVTDIGEQAFYGCTSLTSITIPDSVTDIGEKVFNGCTSLTSITVKANNPPRISNGFLGIPDTCNIYVPAGSVDTYKSEYSAWRSYSNRIFAIDGSSSSDDNDNNESSVSISSNDIEGTYKIIGARDGATFTMNYGDWTFNYLSRETLIK